MEKLVILDCGGQYTKVIDRKVRELGVVSDILPLGVSADELRRAGYGGIILSGGPSSVFARGAPTCDREIFELGVPILGICYGMQLIVEHFGGEVRAGVKTEYGDVKISLDPACPLFADLAERENVLMSHGDAVARMPEGFLPAAWTGEIVAGVFCPARAIFGVQFHPEVERTVNGTAMLRNFLRKICGFTEHYAPEDRVGAAIDAIRARVGEDGKVIVLVSGGVDSAVTAALLTRALRPDQIYAVHVDHGLMRQGESDTICRELASLGLCNLERIDAEHEFFTTPLVIEGKPYKPLCETVAPEEKRAIIGQMFFEVTERALRRLGLDFARDKVFLAQGTLRPDLIESGNPDVSGYAHKIKTHHNDVGVIRALRDAGQVIETNRDWHKDEVRRVARTLGLSEEISSRQPFPGPGLGVRILCCDEEGDDLPDVRMEDRARVAAFVNERSGGALRCEIAPIRSVGVQGDNRSYRALCCLSPERAGDEPLWDELFALAADLPNAFPFLNRVAYCLSGTRGELRRAPLHICHESADLLRRLDAVTTRELQSPRLAQYFAVLLPFGGGSARVSCAIRAVVTSDFMTARPAAPGVELPGDALSRAARALREEVGSAVDEIYYDLTGKPPATVEWE